MFSLAVHRQMDISEKQNMHQIEARTKLLNTEKQSEIYSYKIKRRRSGPSMRQINHAQNQAT